MKNILMAFLVMSLVLSATAIFAQEVTTTGSIAGTVVDQNGAAVPGAKITVIGPTGERTSVANDQGRFEISGLLPGNYKVTTEESGFKKTNVSDVVVFVGKTENVQIKLEPGEVAAEVNVTAGASIDQATTAISSNLNDQLYSSVPVARGVSSLFTLAPGTTTGVGGASDRDNPSISGGTALDNLYVADGVNITNTAFGGIGTFSRSYGSLGTGIILSLVKEVQVKTAGFEPQYGQSEGGIVNIITRSGSNEFHGAVYGYLQPHQLETTRRQQDDFAVNKLGEVLHQEHYDFGADLGGYVPGLRNKLFFFGSFNPSFNRDLVQGAERNAMDLASGSGRDSGLFTLLGTHVNRTRTTNYAFKTDYNISAKHQVAFSIFGDPSSTNVSSFRTLNIDNATAESKLGFGTRNMSGRYTGNFGGSNPLTISASVSQNKNHFDETGFANFNQIINRTQPSRGNFTAIGLGFFEPTQGKTSRLALDATKLVTLKGTHTLSVGYTYQRGSYSGVRDRSGPKFTVPATNADGTLAIDPQAAGQPLNAAFSLRTAGSSCILCPFLTIPGVGDRRVFLRQDRGEFGAPVFDTSSRYHAAYGQDTWRVNKYVTALLGLRWEQEGITGAILPQSGRRNHYTFTDAWAPRIGVTVDPLGKGRTKAFYNFGRFFEFLPLDAAERSLSSEKDFTGGRFAPDFFIDASGRRRAILNQFGTVTPIIDAAHFVSSAIGGTGGPPTVSAQDENEFILGGTKLGYADEHTFGVEQQLKGNWVLSARYIHRKLGRIIEDAAILSPEAANAGIGQVYFIGNIKKSLDAGVNLQPFLFTPQFDPTGNFVLNTPAGCLTTPSGVAGIGPQPVFFNAPTDPFGNSIAPGGVCFSGVGIDANGNSIVTPDGQADGFPDPVHIYKAVEIELNRRFADGWQLFSNFRFARLRGNFEGHLRNDNGQTDPGISSLFDFTEGNFNLLGTQFAVGPLNTERRFVSNIFGSYLFSKERHMFGLGHALHGFNSGINLHMESGLPQSEFFAHPVYLNAGEIPVGGRGKLGRSSFYTRVDLHGDYAYKITEKVSLKFVADWFNITNDRRVFIINQFRESTAGQLNPDFGQPRTFHAPTSLRLGARLEF